MRSNGKIRNVKSAKRIWRRSFRYLLRKSVNCDPKFEFAYDARFYMENKNVDSFKRLRWIALEFHFFKAKIWGGIQPFTRSSLTNRRLNKIFRIKKTFAILEACLNLILTQLRLTSSMLFVYLILFLVHLLNKIGIVIYCIIYKIAFRGKF